MRAVGNNSFTVILNGNVFGKRKTLAGAINLARVARQRSKQDKHATRERLLRETYNADIAGVWIDFYWRLGRRVMRCSLEKLEQTESAMAFGELMDHLKSLGVDLQTS